MNILKTLQNVIRGTAVAAPLPISAPHQTENHVGRSAMASPGHPEIISSPDSSDSSGDGGIAAFQATQSREKVLREMAHQAQRAVSRETTQAAIDKLNREREERRAEEAAQQEERKKQEAARQKNKSWEEIHKNLLGNSQSTISPKLVRVIVDKVGLWDKVWAVEKALKPHMEIIDELETKRREISSGQAMRIFRENLNKNFSKISGGDHVDIPVPFANVEAVEADNAHQRLLLRESMRAEAAKAKPIVEKFAKQLQAAARVCVSEVKAEEIAKSSEYGFPFEASQLLRGLIFAGFELEKRTTQYSNLFPIPHPETFMWGLLIEEK